MLNSNQYLKEIIHKLDLLWSAPPISDELFSHPPFPKTPGWTHLCSIYGFLQFPLFICPFAPEVSLDEVTQGLSKAFRKEPRFHHCSLSLVCLEQCLEERCQVDGLHRAERLCLSQPAQKGFAWPHGAWALSYPGHIKALPQLQLHLHLQHGPREGLTV